MFTITKRLCFVGLATFGCSSYATGNEHNLPPKALLPYKIENKDLNVVLACAFQSGAFNKQHRELLKFDPEKAPKKIPSKFVENELYEGNWCTFLRPKYALGLTQLILEKMCEQLTNEQREECKTALTGSLQLLRHSLAMLDDQDHSLPTLVDNLFTAATEENNFLCAAFWKFVNNSFLWRANTEGTDFLKRIGNIIQEKDTESRTRLLCLACAACASHLGAKQPYIAHDLLSFFSKKSWLPPPLNKDALIDLWRSLCKIAQRYQDDNEEPPVEVLYAFRHLLASRQKSCTKEVKARLLKDAETCLPKALFKILADAASYTTDLETITDQNEQATRLNEMTQKLYVLSLCTKTNLCTELMKANNEPHFESTTSAAPIMIKWYPKLRDNKLFARNFPNSLLNFLSEQERFCFEKGWENIDESEVSPKPRSASSVSLPMVKTNSGSKLSKSLTFNIEVNYFDTEPIQNRKNKIGE